jgi:hypothetical protein
MAAAPMERTSSMNRNSTAGLDYSTITLIPEAQP